MVLKAYLGPSVNSPIIVSDRYNQLIKIFSPSGMLISKIGGHGIFKKPFHCVQHDNYLVVSDSAADSIKVFDSYGNFLYAFGKTGDGDGDFKTLRCLSVTKAGQLVVCDRNNHRIQFFELSGKFVGQFGAKGGEIGQFNGPISSAVLSDGRIVVTDIDNNRVQILE